MIVVVGIGAGGWDEIPVRHQQLIRESPVLLGGKRHLDLVPDVPGQRREPWPSPLREGLPALLDGIGDAVALASGDPLVSGIGTTLISLLGRENVRIEPAVSSVALARARMGWPAESCVAVSLVGRDVALVARELAPGRRILALSADESTAASVANLLVTTGFGASTMTVLGELGAETESARTGTASSWAGESPRLNIVAIECVGVPARGWAAGLPDDVFENDGQLTKRDLRASALARLAPTPGAHLWDVGAGAGSVGIEWMRAHPTCTTTAIEGNAERAARIARNATRLGVPGLRVVEGRAPDALAGLAAPDAIFIGGGATRPGVLDTCLAALRPGGRLVVHGVTLETEQLLARQHAELGGELTRISVESVDMIGTFRGWAPQRTVVQWTLQRAFY
ncbi:bifunctional cobalt-precorrin-7 (C(5))-methyltransferase/cobalt-precorrin-6B (C(15))-methyltransferase [Nocardioides luteus]|uniref:Cobalamin biosynthesis bifunctional protein CbiET n=1 Tax=Nocardioides luteus TaxID=1844 RepID=A0A1J4N0P2_9ACTN|nr:bifunctional cobalt-precorrin-7 (C(5))-methyltransferase/cobalt-precorrin-6B (C(15))-methyltransferase [Nocardioides luteus]OIJ25148.1 cobalamin biosynthesis bifunctional protein CbiET [Nocardioides luteus]